MINPADHTNSPSWSSYLRYIRQQEALLFRIRERSLLLPHEGKQGNSQTTVGVFRTEEVRFLTEWVRNLTE
jgi:hypothetical protein